MRSFAVFLSVLAIGVGLAAPAGAATPRIVGGTPVADGAYPFMAALVFAGEPAETGWFCGAEVIAPTIVLTASHCVADLAPGDVEVALGSNRLSEMSTFKEVTGIALAPDADPFGQLANDLAVLKLATPAGVAPLAIADPGEPADVLAYQPGKGAIVTGWGSLHPDPGASQPYYSDRLMHTNLQIVSDDDCENAYGLQAFFHPDSVVCANWPPDNAHDACYGDSGGPLFTIVGGVRKIIGVVSSGEGCAQPGYPGTYAEVTSPDLYDFATGYRDGTLTAFAPVNEDPPSVVGTPKPQNTLTCDPGTWNNDPDFSYQWGVLISDFGDEFFEPFEGQDGQTYDVRDADAGTSVGCLVTGSNDVGSSEAFSDFVEIGSGAVTPPPVVPPVNNPDVAAPQAKLVSRECARTRRCKLVVQVSDATPSSGIASVAAGVTSRTAVRCKRASQRRRHVHCFRTKVRKGIQAKQVEGGVFTLSLGKLPKGRQTVVVETGDKAGNRRAKALVVRFRL